MVYLYLLAILIPIVLSSTELCDFKVHIEQKLDDDGFHRNLTYEVLLSEDDEDLHWLFKDCMFGIDQELPPGLFVNNDELRDLRRLGKVNAFCSSKVNVELSTEDAAVTRVNIIGKPTRSRIINLWVPVHARYHRSTDNIIRTAVNIITHPKLYLQCPDNRLEMCKLKRDKTALCRNNAQCPWRRIPYTELTTELRWEVPVGNLQQALAVSVGSLLVVLVGSLHLSRAIHRFKLTRTTKTK